MNKKGFTMIEMLVVTAIIVIISAITIVNFRKGEQTNKLQLSAQRIAQTLRQIQNMALSSTELANPYPAGPKEVPEGGYVLYFDRGPGINTYNLYADFDGNKILNLDGTETVETITLEKGVYLNDIIYIKRTGVVEGYQSFNFTNIICKSPHAFVTFQPPNPPADRIVVSITNLSATCAPDNCCSNNCERGISCSADPNCRAVKINKDTGEVDIIK